MGVSKRNFKFIRKHCATTASRLFDDFESKRKSVLLDVAREFYPLGVAGLAKGVEELADECPYDEDHRILNTTPVTCLREGATGFHANLTTPNKRWFRLEVPSFAQDPSDAADVERSEMLDDLTDAVEKTLRYAHVYPQLYKLYEHLLCFGFACMLVTRDRERVVRARTLRIGTYAMEVGADGLVCRVARRFSWTAEQILSEFGDYGVPQQIRDAAKKYDTKRRWTVYNLIEPNATGDLKAYDKVARALRLSNDMIYRSIYWLECGKDDDPQSGVLEISGFSAKPIIAPRLDRELGDTYGRGRGMDGLDAARGLQSFQYDILKISGRKAEPPLVAASEFKDEGLKLWRGAVNYARFGESRDALVMPALAQEPSSVEIRHDRQDAEAELKKLFFNDAFATIDALKNSTGVRTATEIDALVRENMEKLNPVLTNLDYELLDPLVSVVTRYALQAGVIVISEEDVASLAGVNIEYVSQIHLAAKRSQMGAVDLWMEFIGRASRLDPTAIDKFDADGAIDAYAQMLGVQAKCRATDEAVETKRTERAAAVDAQKQMEALKGAAEMAKVAGAPVDENHLGGRLIKQLEKEG